MEWEPLIDRQWRSMSGPEEQNILDWVNPHLHIESDVMIHIGTDAQAKNKRIDFVTVVAVLHPGHGGRVFSTRTKLPHINSLYQKLMNETLMSLEVAFAIIDSLTDEQRIAVVERIRVHVDANTNPEYKSSDHVKALAGMVTGSGFKYVLKPDAWCASHCADHVVKNKNKFNGEHGAKRKRRKK